MRYKKINKFLSEIKNIKFKKHIETKSKHISYHLNNKLHIIYRLFT